MLASVITFEIYFNVCLGLYPRPGCSHHCNVSVLSRCIGTCVIVHYCIYACACLENVWLAKEVEFVLPHLENIMGKQRK